MTAWPTTTEFARRIEHAAAQVAEAGLSALLVTPGADLAYLTGHSPMITERLTLLVLPAAGSPAMVVPRLERGDAETASGVAITDWRDGQDPYAAAAALLEADGRYAISDAAWAMHVLALQHALPRSRYVSITQALPMLRAAKARDEIRRLAAAAAAADACFEDISGVRFSGRRESQIAADLAALL